MMKKIRNKIVNERNVQYFIVLFYILIVVSIGVIINIMLNKGQVAITNVKIINIEESEKLPGSIEKVAIKANPPDNNQSVALIRLELKNAEVINVETIKEMTIGVCDSGLLFTDNSICADVADPNKIVAGEDLLYAYIRWGQSGRSQLVTAENNGYFNGQLLTHMGEQAYADIGGVLPYTGDENTNNNTLNTFIIVATLFGLSLLTLLLLSRRSKILKRASMVFGVLFILSMAFAAIYIASNLNNQNSEPIEIYATPIDEGWTECINDDQGTAHCSGWEPMAQCGSRNMGVTCDGEPDRCGICTNCKVVYILGGSQSIECGDAGTSTDPCVTKDHRWGYYRCNGVSSYSCDDWTTVPGSNVACNSGQQCLSGMGCVGGDTYSIYSSTDYCSALSVSNMLSGSSQSIRGAINSATKSSLRALWDSVKSNEKVYLTISAIKKSKLTLTNVTVKLENIPSSQWLPTSTEDGIVYIDITDKLQNLSYEHDVSFSIAFTPTLAPEDKTISFATSIKVGMYNPVTKQIENVNNRRIFQFSCFLLTFNNAAVSNSPTVTPSTTVTATLRTTATATPRVTATVTPRVTATASPRMTATPTQRISSPTPTTPSGKMSCGQTGCTKDSDCETGLPNYECDETEVSGNWPEDNVCIKVCGEGQTRIDSCNCSDVDPDKVVCGPVDVNNDNLLNYIDLAAFSEVYNNNCSDSPYTGGGCGGKDNNGDGSINYIDLGFFSSHYYPKASSCLP